MFSETDLNRQISGIFDDLDFLDNFLTPIKEDNIIKSDFAVDFIYRDTYEQAIQYAADNDLEVVYPKDNELFLDIDSDEAYQAYRKAYVVFECKFNVLKNVETLSKSGNKHITITLDKKLNTLERIAMQAMLGSDGKREVLSLVRYFNSEPWPTLFFEKRKTEGANS